VTSLEPRPRSRILIPLLVALLGIAGGTGGLVLVRPFVSRGTEQVTAVADKDPAAKPLSGPAVRARVEPSVVDVTATLTYEDETASGTGFVVAEPVAEPITGPTTGPTGGRAEFILTNNHVIRDSTSVDVTVPATGQTYPASIVGLDVAADVAVLSITPDPALPSAPLGDSATIASGTPVISFGNQAGAGGSPTVARGVITGTGRTILADDGAAGFSETLHNMLATTAQIEPGDSGGPLTNTAGSVIGVDTAAGMGGAPTGYAIPINAAMAAARQIIARQEGQGITLGVNGFLGVIVESSTSRSPVAQQEQEQGSKTGPAASPASATCVPTQAAAAMPGRIAPAPAGALVVGVLCGTGAARTGIVPGDVITAVAGRPVNSPDALTTIVDGYPPGSVLPVTWVSASSVTWTAQVQVSQAPAVLARLRHGVRRPAGTIPVAAAVGLPTRSGT
jgi:S1-C subfamily serine protease